MRRENVGSGRPFIAVAAILFITFSNNWQVGAQELPRQIAALLERQAEEGGDPEGMAARLEEMMRDKVSINSLSRRKLEECGLFSAFQIESILDYRKTCGDILSRGELALVDGFNDSVAEMCEYFFSFDSENDVAAPYREPHWAHLATAKAKSGYDSGGVGLTAKYTASYADRVKAGFTLDSDAGEGLTSAHMPDFVSGYAAYNGRGILRSVILGDYSVRAGQGLVCWKAFNFTAFGAPSSVIKTSRAARPYTSSDESNYFRGVAATLALWGAEVTLFASRSPVDARVLGDSVYTSVVKAGYHRTAAERAKRHAMHEYVGGLTAAREAGRWRFGVNAIAYRYDKANGRTVKEYNRYQMYDGWWGDASADIFCYWHNCRFFAEAALDARASPAALGGVLWSPSYSLEMSLFGRLYSKSYIAPHAGAYSSLSNCANQRGVTWSARWLPNPLWELQSNLQYSYYPWSRYGIYGPSHAFKYRIEADYTPGKQLTASAQLSGSDRLRWRAGCRYAFASRWSAEARYAGTPGGNGAFFECAYAARRLRFAARLTVWDTDGWDSRLYFYEGGMPQSFSIEARSGKGTGAYLSVRYAPVKAVEVWLKASDSYAAFFTRIFIPG